MDVLTIINYYFAPGSAASDILIEHSSLVMEKAIAVAEHVSHLSPDITFIKEAAMLHDIGIVFVHAPELGCHGDRPYICHGYLGRELLEKEGFPRHALVCERHIGTGLGITDIEALNLPLPMRDMRPQTIEEKIVCYADKFYSKRIGRLRQEKSEDEVREELEKFGPEKLGAFEELHRLFNNRSSQEKGRLQEQ
ncbi:MAG: HD domain-containing protein [Nitrospirae bacterium]|nr:HD domain-containing protein [Nitrospirota bacterium]